MQPRRRPLFLFLAWTAAASVAGLATAYAAAGNQVAAPAGDDITIASDACTTAKLGSDVPVEKIGEPVRRVTLAAPTWTAETANEPAYCRVDGVIEPVDTSATARPINFGVALPAHWNRRVGADGRRRHERHRARTLTGGGRSGRTVAARARHRDVRQRLRASGRLRPCRGGAGRRGRGGRAARRGAADGRTDSLGARQRPPPCGRPAATDVPAARSGGGAGARR